MSDSHVCHNTFPSLPPESRRQSHFSLATLVDTSSECILDRLECWDLRKRFWGRGDGLHSAISRGGVLFNGIYKLRVTWKCWDNRGGFEGPPGEQREERSGMAGERNLCRNFVPCHWVPCELSSLSSQETFSKLSISCWYSIELNLFVKKIHSSIHSTNIYWKPVSTMQCSRCGR